MIDFDLYNYYKESNDHNIILTFKGAISQDILVEIGSLIKSKFALDKKIKQIFAVFVEMSQNIMHYSDERVFFDKDGKEVGVGIIIFTESNGSFYITSGNQVKSTKVEKITSRIEEVNNHSKEELRDLYLEKRKLPREAESKGAGLGLIDIARKTSGKIYYKISRINDEMSFMTMSVKFEKEHENG